jgi:hypothetical protein
MKGQSLPPRIRRGDEGEEAGFPEGRHTPENGDKEVMKRLFQEREEKQMVWKAFELSHYKKIKKENQNYQRRFIQ